MNELEHVDQPFACPKTRYFYIMQHLNYTTPEEVVTRRSVGFYLGTGIVIFFLGGIAALLFALAENAGSCVPALLAILFVAGVPFTIVASFRSTPIVHMSSSGINYKGQYYPWEDIHRVELTGSKTAKYIRVMPVEGTRIVLKSGEEITLQMSSYSNLPEVRRFLANIAPLQRYMSDSEQEVGATVDTAVEVGVNEVQWFTGNSLLNTNGLTACFLLLLAIVPIVLVGFVDIFILLSVMIGGLAALLSMYVNYIGVSGEYIMVRNVFRPWKRKKYLLTDIRQIIFAHQNRVNVIRLIFKDFTTKQIFADGLRNKDWFALLGLLRSRGIEVVDELNFTERVKW